MTWAAERGPVVGLYVHETVGRGIGRAAAWWLRHSLDALRESLPAPLIELAGDPRPLRVAVHTESWAGTAVDPEVTAAVAID